MSRKSQSPQHAAILRQLLREEANKTCVDCKTSKNPRWASWSLGCFICIRCSGIHRSMGTHISKVKSVDLDTWTDEQIESMVRWGNDKCNAFWESKLPPNYVPNEAKIENFIRTKYDMKKWAAGSNPAKWKPENHDDFGEFEGAQVSEGSATSQTQIKNVAKPNPRNVASPNPNQRNVAPSSDISDLFSATPPVSAPSSSAPSPQSTGGNMGRPDLKKSILSLYSSPSSSQTFPRQLKSPGNESTHSLSAGITPSRTSSPSVPPNVSQSNKATSGSSLAHSLGGLSLQNEWGDVQSSWKPVKTGLDDDLFKNVWS